MSEATHRTVKFEMLVVLQVHASVLIELATAGQRVGVSAHCLFVASKQGLRTPPKRVAPGDEDGEALGGDGVGVGDGREGGEGGGDGEAGEHRVVSVRWVW